MQRKVNKKSQKGSGCGCGSAKRSLLKNYRKSLSSKIGQSGGGYSVNPEQMVAGLPIYQSYDDCCPPAVVKGRLMHGANNGSSPVCGSQKGGKGKKMNKSMRKNKKSKSMEKNNKSKSMRKNKKTKKSMRKTNKGQRGGSVGHRSQPASFPKSFDTPKSNFSANMNERVFDEFTPDHTPNAI